MTMSNTILAVTLPSGNRAVYEVQPQHINEVPGLTLAERARAFGTQLAHKQDGVWYGPGGWNQVTDVKLIDYLERVKKA